LAAGGRKQETQKGKALRLALSSGDDETRIFVGRGGPRPLAKKRENQTWH